MSSDIIFRNYTQQEVFLYEIYVLGSNIMVLEQDMFIWCYKYLW
jgi:hypothetical protein